MSTTPRKSAISVTITGDVIDLQFANGNYIKFAASEMSHTICQQAMMHGFKQKLVDAAAMSCHPDTGRPATIDDKYAAVRAVYDRLLGGEWNKTREGGTTSGGLLFRALCELYSTKTPEQIREFMDKKNPAEQAALRSVPKISVIIDRIKAESAKSSGIDTDELLGDLE